MPIKVKDNDKCKEWEKRRRDRLNDAFKNLAQLLPHYDPAKVEAKIDTLEKATAFVKELRLSNSRLLTNQTENDEKCKLIKELQDEANRLIIRVKQLTVLLKKANITIPTGPEIKSLGNKRFKWTGKLKPEDLENLTVLKSIGNSPCDKPSNDSTQGKDSTSPSPSLQTEETTNCVSGGSNGPTDAVRTNSDAAVNTSVASIIVPLREANSSKDIQKSTKGKKVVESDKITSTISTNSPNIIITVSNSSTSPVSEKVTVPIISPSTTASSATISTSTQPTTTALPKTTFLSAEPIFTTSTTATPIQLPLQTFILAPCQIAGTTGSVPTAGQQPQIFTRFTNILPVGSTILSNPNSNGIAFQKIPIKPVLKPIPKVIHRRKRRSKKDAQDEVGKPLEKKQKVAKETEKEVKSEDKEKSAPAEISKETASSEDNSAESVSDECVQIITPTPVPDPEEKDKNKEEPAAKAESGANTEANESEKQLEKVASINNKNKQSPPPAQLLQLVEVCLEKSDKSNDDDTMTIQTVDDEKSQTNREPNSVTVEVNNILLKEPDNSDNIPVLRIIETNKKDSEMEESSSNILANVVVSDDRQELLDTVSTTTTTNELQLKSVKASPHEGPEITPEKTISASITTVPAPEESGSLPDNQNKNENPRLLDTEKVSTDNVSKTVIDEVAVTKTPEKVDKEPQETNTASNTVSSISDPTNALSGENEEVAVKTTVVTTAPITTTSQSNSFEELRVPETTGNEVTSKVLPEPVKEHSTPVAVAVTLEQTQTSAPATLTVEDAAPLSSMSLLEPRPKDPTPKSSPVVNAGKALREIIDASESVTTDKISECIARSIDLIDANDSELMELSEHWEDTGGSPKSPISPTQMFLNIFPLLPRESSIHDHPSHNQSHQTPAPVTNLLPQSQKSSSSHLPFIASSNSRSSFFIDAMLPDEHSASTANATIMTVNNEGLDIIPSSSSNNHNNYNTSSLALTPPQYSSPSSQQISSPFSFSNNFYWTPAATTTSSTCAIEATNDFRLHSYPQGNHNHWKSSSKSIPSSSTSTSISTSNPNATSTSTTTSSSSKSENSRTANKSSKASAARLPKTLNLDATLPNYSKPKNVSTTTTTTSATSTTTVDVTWTLTAPTATQSNSSLSSNIQSQFETQNHHQHLSTSNSGSCSLLDALNPMDASFFRPLINALEDFRTLDFQTTSTLAPPPPHLPSLIPPPPHSSKSLYTPQFNSGSQTIQNPMSVNFHSSIAPPSSIHHDQAQPSPFLHHQLTHNSAPIFNQEQTQQTSRRQSSQSSAPVAQSSSSGHHEPPSKSHKSGSSADKTSRTSGRQKGESSKQSRSGKSSRTQPYVAPASTSTCSSSNTIIQSQHGHGHKPLSIVEGVQVTNPISSKSAKQPTATVIPSHSISTPTANLVPILTGHHQNQNSKPYTLPTSKSFSFQTQNILDSNTFESGRGDGNVQHMTQHFTSSLSQVDNSGTTSTQPQVARSTTSSSETRSRKTKEDKSQTHAAPKSKSHQTVPSSFHMSQHSSQVQPTSLSHSLPNQNVTVTNHPPPTAPPQLQLQTSLNQQSNASAPPQVLHIQSQSSTETFQLFPEYSGNSSGTRQFSNFHGQHHPYQEIQSQAQHHQHHSQSQLDFASQRTHPHPYYLPDIANFENVTVTDHVAPTVQAHITPVVHHISRQVSTASAVSSGSTQNQNSSNNSKFMYGSNNLPSSQQSVVPSSNASNSRALQFTYSQPQPQLPQSSTQRQQPQELENTPAVPSYNSQQTHLSNRGASHISQTHPPRHTQQEATQHQQAQPQAQHSTSSTVSGSKTANKNLPTPALQPTTFQITHQAPPQIHHIHHSQSGHVHQQTQQHQHHKAPQSHSQQQQQGGQTQGQASSGRQTSSRTVNWMTDTAYRTNTSTSGNSNSSNNSNSTSHKQRQNIAANNPFSVSKLVGNTSVASAPVTKNPQNDNSVTGHSSNSNNNSRSKSSTSGNTSNPTVPTTAATAAAGSGTGNAISQNQSNYCAEALIRKNPNPMPQSNDWIEFNVQAAGTQSGQGFHGYPTSTPHPQHGHSNIHHHNPPTAENFSNYSNLPGQYYHTHTHPSSSSASHFSQFDHHHPHGHHHQNIHNPHTHHFQTPTQPLPPLHPQPHHHQHHPTHPHTTNQNQPSTSGASSNSNYQSSAPASITGPHVMPQMQGQGQAQSSQTNQNPLHYQTHHHDHHHHHSSNLQHNLHNHSSSTSSVSNFNLSTIFPEINDKRSNSSGNSHSHRGSGGGNSGPPAATSTTTGGNANAGCSYQQHHRGFGSSSSVTGNVHQ